MKAKPMKIALIIENSQAAKNAIVHEALTAVAEPLGLANAEADETNAPRSIKHEK